MVSSISLVALTTKSQATTTNKVQAATAASFIDSIGVGAHIDSGTPSWMDENKIASEIAFLGITHVRDGTPYDWALPNYVALAKTGVKFDLIQMNPTAAAMTTVGSLQDVQRADTLERAVPGSVDSLEGANEYNISTYDLNGNNSYGNLAWGQADDRDLQASVMADPTLAGVKVVAASTALVAAAPVVTRYVDASNWHVYGGVGQQLGSIIAAGITAAQGSAPGKPVYVTEAGISSSGYGSSSWGVTDEATQAIIDTNALLDGYKLGAARTFLYDLMDDTNNTTQENHFGLFRADGTAKPVAVEISNLIKLISDHGAAMTKPAGTLGYGITGLPSTASSMLLQKASGEFDIVVWNGGAKLYDGTGDVTPPTSAVTVRFEALQNVNTYDPMSGLVALQSSTSTNSMTFGLSKDPVVLEVTASPTSIVPSVTATVAPSVVLPNSPSTLAPAATNTLGLSLSEDAWNGDAQFTVAVDGKQVGGTYTATASHTAGASQAISLGTLASGTHQVALSFINDAYGGSASTDRNLYVDSGTLNGKPIAGSTFALFSNGTLSFGVTVPAAITSTAVINVSEDAWTGDAQFTVAVDSKQMGGTYTATALHGAGQMQAITIAGIAENFAPHDIAITFLNDAYGGTASTDRNLYVNSIMFDKQTVAGASATLYSSGTQQFTATAPTNWTG